MSEGEGREVDILTEARAGKIFEELDRFSLALAACFQAVKHYTGDRPKNPLLVTFGELSKEFGSKFAQVK
jgi:hypothetical protein